MTTLTNNLKNMDGDVLIEWLEDYVSNLDKRDPYYAVFKKQLAQTKENEAKLKATQLKLEETNEKLKNGLQSYIGQFVAHDDDETVPYLLEKYKDDLLELSEMIQEVENKFIELHCKVYEVEEYKNIYMDYISCCVDLYFENYNKFEETKGINSFIGAVTYIDMLYKSGDIDHKRLVELCIGLFKDHEDNDDSCFACVTDGRMNTQMKRTNPDTKLYFNYVDNLFKTVSSVHKIACLYKNRIDRGIEEQLWSNQMMILANELFDELDKKRKHLLDKVEEYYE